MTRVVSIYLPDLATDRIRRADPSIPADQAIAVIAKSGSKRWVSAADPAARKAGVRVGMQAAKAQALFRGLMMVDADPAADSAALERITLWALTQYSPIVAMDAPDGIVLDTEGADHLQGGVTVGWSECVAYGRSVKDWPPFSDSASARFNI